MAYPTYEVSELGEKSSVKLLGNFREEKQLSNWALKDLPDGCCSFN